MIEKTKVSIIGDTELSYVIASLIAPFVDEIVIFSNNKDKVRGKSRELTEMAVTQGYKTEIMGTDTIGMTARSHFIVMTVGSDYFQRPIGLNQLSAFATAIAEYAVKLFILSPEAVYIGATPFSEVLTHIAYDAVKRQKELKCRAKQFIGTGCILASSRLIIAIAQFNRVERHKLGNEMLIVGSDEYGEDGRVILMQIATANFLCNMTCTDDFVEWMMGEVNNAESKIRKIGYNAVYSQASVVVELIRGMCNPTQRLFTCGVYARNAYGFGDVFIALPTIISRQGVQGIHEMRFLPKQMNVLNYVARENKQRVNELIKVLY